MKSIPSRLFLSSAFIFLSWCIVINQALARTIHVSQRGNDEASGAESAPLRSIQAGIDRAVAGDTVLIGAGVYEESLRTRAAGNTAAPITVQAAVQNEVTVTSDKANVLFVGHPYVHISQLVFDGKFAKHDIVRVDSTADGFVFERNVVINGAKDGIDLGNASTRVGANFDYLDDVTIARCEFRNFLARDIFGERKDAHGIVAGGVRNLRITQTNVATVSGDALQLANGNWDRVYVENVHFTNGSIDQALAIASGFEVGLNPGENAIDTKQDANLRVRGRLYIRDSQFDGWRGSLISNAAALNLKEKVTVIVEGCEIHDNEIAMRLRGAVGDNGAHVFAKNNVIYANDKALRVEDGLRELRLLNNTFGGGGIFEFVAGGAGSGFFAANNLLHAPRLPKEFPTALNRAIDASSFVDVGTGNFRLVPASPAIDSALSLREITNDALGVPRPQGQGYDFGAYEYR